MKKFLFFVLVVFMSGTVDAVPAVVDYVLDGDTFAAQVNLASDVGVTVRVRLRNVDTPELSGECHDEINLANRARNRVRTLLPRGTIVELENIKDDKYLGRIDANVYLPDGRDIGDVLVRENLARPYNGGKRAGWCK